MGTTASCSSAASGSGLIQHMHQILGVLLRTKSLCQIFPIIAVSIIIFLGYVNGKNSHSELNKSHASHQVRVKSEHAVGYLKGRFASLKGLHQQVDDPRDHERAVAWIKTCIVIHSLVFLIENGEEDQDYVDELVEEGLDGDHPSNEENTASEAERARQGQNFRDQLKDKLLVYLDENDYIYL